MMLTAEQTNETLRLQFNAAFVHARLLQHEFADALGLNQATVSRYLSGKLPIPFHVLLNAIAIAGGAVTFQVQWPGFKSDPPKLRLIIDGDLL